MAEGGKLQKNPTTDKVQGAARSRKAQLTDAGAPDCCCADGPRICHSYTSDACGLGVPQSPKVYKLTIQNGSSDFCGVSGDFDGDYYVTSVREGEVAGHAYYRGLFLDGDHGSRGVTATCYEL